MKGAVVGSAVKSGNRLICCCDCCQKFVRELGADETVLDKHGGTDIFQTSPASLRITQGEDQIRCLRLSEKGTYRWYASCCNTPIGNTAKPSLPFVGVIHSFIADKTYLEELVGSPRARVQTLHAYDLPEDAPKPVGFPLSITLGLIGKILKWKISGKGQPNPFFKDAATPIVEPAIKN